MSLSTYVDVTVVRWLDGHRIETHHDRITRAEAFTLKVEEQCLPGVLATFRQRDHARPWEDPTPD